MAATGPFFKKLAVHDVERKPAGTAQSCSAPKTEIIPVKSLVGGGSAPTSTLPTLLVAVTASDFSTDELAARLRHRRPPIVDRVEEGRVPLDLGKRSWGQRKKQRSLEHCVFWQADPAQNVPVVGRHLPSY
jgi:seryl-tRNA(Sec) selenium transferase